MENDAFTQIVNKRCEKIKEVIASKGKSYARDDRLHNFKELGMRKHETPEKALHGLAEKHNLSVFEIILDIEEGNYNYLTLKYIDEKIGDSINYLILLEALLRERLMQDEFKRKSLEVQDGEGDTKHND